MSDDLEVRSGGAILVDTESVGYAAQGFERAAGMCGGLAAELEQLSGILSGLRPFDCDDAATQARVLAIRGDEASAEAGGLAQRLRITAAAYERVELEAAHAVALAGGDERLARLLAGRVVALRLITPRGDSAFPVTHDGFFERRGDLIGQWMQAPPIAPMGLAMVGFGVAALGVVDRIGAGTVPASARLGGTPPGVRVFPVAAPASIGGATPSGTAPRSAVVFRPMLAPEGLAAAAARVPGSDKDRVRVERYTMADGSRQFAVYVAGTQAVGASGTEAWDLGSNLGLYGGEASASYQATVEALRQAGVGPKDPVHAFGYSQGGMVASRLALEEGFTVSTLVTFGSPVEADVGADTLSVVLRHTDDPVAALAGEGFAAGVGVPGSFVAERHGDPVGGIADVVNPIRAHRLDAYAETAGMLDASTDPRMDAVRGVFAGLATAASVNVTVFGAERLPSAAAKDPALKGHRGR